MTLTHLIALILVGALCGLIAERLIRSSLPYGLIGAIAAGLIGAWLWVDVLHLPALVPDLALAGIPIISAILGAIILILVFNLVTSRGRLRWRR